MFASMRLGSSRAIASGLLVLVAAAGGWLLLGPGAKTAAAPASRVAPQLSSEERAVWRPLPVSRAGIPVLLYHGIGERAEFRSAADAAYALTRPNFVKQMALLHAGGYETITLDEFRRFHAGEQVALPPRPILLTFDDALAGSFAGADAILRELGWTAVMFVDVGAVDAGTSGYADWERLRAAKRSGRWELQLHSGRGHRNIAYDELGTTGPFYAYRAVGHERLSAWWRRVRSDIGWGDARLRTEVPGYRALSFAPPYGNYGQLATDDPRIPQRLGSWLRERFGLVFVQEPARYARPGDAFVPRLQVTRRMTGGEIHAWLARELPR
jgi:peptidoglycan/xylan/chitin deacetylase (PgdA/CDA1 family)